MVTRSVSFGPTSPTADTEGTIGSAYTFPSHGRIVKIYVTGMNGVAAKSGAAILYLYFKRLLGPFEFAICTMQGLTDVYPLPINAIDVDLPYDNGEVVTVKIKTSETQTEMTVSLLCVE